MIIVFLVSFVPGWCNSDNANISSPIMRFRKAATLLQIGGLSVPLSYGSFRTEEIIVEMIR